MNLRVRSFPPLVGLQPQVLILGSMPGIASLNANRYYAHPRNQFWPLLSALLADDLAALPYAARLRRLARHRVGLWDVIAACRRSGSLDSAIRDAQYNDLAGLRQRAPDLRLVLHNGAQSARMLPHTLALGVPALRLPSTSPANAGWSFERKLQAWRDAFALAGVD